MSEEWWLTLGPDGKPSGVIDGDRVHREGLRLMMAVVTASRDGGDAVDEVLRQWIGSVDPVAGVWISATAMSLLAKRIVGPLIAAAARSAPELDVWENVAAQCADAERELGGDR